eukprot:scaffold24581_cov70-Skeletonema_dohrnii-CCMP3373.AAC.3
MQNADIVENFEECNEVKSLVLEASKQQLILWIEVTAAALGAPTLQADSVSLDSIPFFIQLHFRPTMQIHTAL